MRIGVFDFCIAANNIHYYVVINTIIKYLLGDVVF